jgi:hypothetical protein
VIRTAVFTVLACGALSLSALAAPAFAFETQSAPAPKAGGAFTDLRMLQGMMPGTTSAAFHFGPAEAPAVAPDLQQTPKPTVIYELKGGKPSDRIDVTDPRDNPFLQQFDASPSRPSQIAH